MVKPVALPEAIKSNQPPTTSKRRCSMPRPLHVAALVLAVAAMLLSVRLTAEQWDIGGLPLFRPKRPAPRAWLPQPVPVAVPLALPEQAKQPTVGESESEEAVQPAIVLEPMRADAAAAVSSDAAAAITAAASATAAQPAVTSISTPADTIAPGATAAAGTDAAAVSVDLLSGVSVALRGLRDVSGGQPAQVRDAKGATETPSTTAETDTPNTAQVSTGTVWGANPYGP